MAKPEQVHVLEVSARRSGKSAAMEGMIAEIEARGMRVYRIGNHDRFVMRSFVPLDSRPAWKRANDAPKRYRGRQ